MRNFKEVITAVMAIAIFSFSCMPVPARTLIGNYGSVVPYANSTYNVGSPTQYWDYGYFSHLQVGDLVYAGNVTAHAPTHASGGADPVNHNTLSNLTTGDPHTQYIKADGTRAFAGAQSMGGNSLVTMADPTNNQDAATKIYVDTHGNVTGTGGIANMIPYWTIAQNLNSTNMYYNSVTNRYGIGTIVPELALQVHDGTGPNGIQLSYTIGTLYTNITNDIFGYLRLMPSGGRVGINDLTPVKTLDVGGDAQIQGNLTMDSHNINNVADPSAAQDAVTLAYYNAHLPAGGSGNVTASSMTTGYIPVATSATGITNSIISANSSNITIAGNLTFSSGNSIKTNTQDLTVVTGVAKTLVLDTPVYEDMIIVMSNVKAPAADSPVWTVYKGSEVPAFKKDATNVLYFSTQLPHAYKVDSNIEFHIHLAYPDNGVGNSTWQFTYSWASIGDNFPLQTSVSANITSPATTDKHQFAQMVSSINGVGKNISSILICSISRIGGLPYDNYDNNIYLISGDFHYQRDTQGSRQETAK
jgi:hypothetical protein